MLLSLKCNKREAKTKESLATTTTIKMLDQTQHNLKVEDPHTTKIKALSSFKATNHNANYVENTDTLLLHAITDLISIFKGVIFHIQLPTITHFLITIVAKFKPW